MCPKKFYKAAHLVAHVESHMGVRKHSCDLCPKRFGTSFELKTHKVSAHNIGKLFLGRDQSIMCKISEKLRL